MEKSLAEVTIHWRGEESRHPVRRGLGLQALAARVATPLQFDCRKADCGICVIKVRSGNHALSPATFAERDFLKAMAADANERLACQCRVLGDVTIEVEF